MSKRFKFLTLLAVLFLAVGLFLGCEGDRGHSGLMGPPGEPAPVPEPDVWVSYGTAGGAPPGPLDNPNGGSPPTATLVGEYVELYTAHGGFGSAYVRLNIEGGIPLEAIHSLIYSAKLVSFYGRSNALLEVVFNIDADDDGELEGTGLAWMTPPMHDPAALGDDNFLSGDPWPYPTTPDLYFVERDALGSEYYYWCSNDTRDGFSAFWSQFDVVRDTKLPAHDIDLADRVHSIDFICGTSGSWIDATIQVLDIELNGIVYEMPAE